MTSTRWTGGVRFLAVATLAALAGACAPERMAPPPFVPHAASGTVSWQPLIQRDVRSPHEGATVEVDVKGGELLRLETSSDEPLPVGQRVHASAAGDVEEWSTVTPHDHVALVRPTLFTTAVRFPRGKVDRALIGHGFDPGYLWFELESRVLDWAKGPLPAPFPQIGPPERIDFDALSAIDRALADAVSGASDRDAAMTEARAVRRVVGLRAARLLRPVNGFPYFFDDDLEPEGHPKTRDDHGRTGYELTPDAPLEVVVNGPTLLHLWSRAPRSEEGEVERVRVTEGGHERAVSGATLPHVVRNTESDPSRPDVEGDDPAALSSLRRASVHVPPGQHRYRVEMSGGERLWIYPLRAREIVHLEDAIAGVKSETHQLGLAREACHGGPPAICAFALALAGKDGEAADDDHAASWQDVLTKIPAPARDAAIDLARGGPRDPSLALEVAASAGDDAALTKLSDAAAHETDDVLRDSWMRAVLRGTRWVNAGAEGELQATWTALLVDEAAGAKCAAASDTPWTELGHDDIELATTTWHGVRSVDLMANVPCDARGPVQLVVDGETLTASPSSGHARWHVLVHGATAHAKRIDAGGGHVLAMRATDGACGAHWGQVAAPHAAASHPKLVYEEGTRAPGVEVWLREGATSGKVDVTGPGGEAASVLVRGQRGVSAIDEHGVRWTRQGRLPLPVWAAAGAVVGGGDDVAVRAVVRAPRWSGGAATTTAASARAPEPLDEARLIELSRAILALPPAQRGPAYLQRALVLAGGGATKGALEDARAAKALGAGSADPEVLVRAALRTRPAQTTPLSPSVKAFGVEPDFDPGAGRCRVNESGPRARLAQLEEQLKSAPRNHAWDESLAVRAFEIAHADASDPRAEALARRSTWGSRWQLVRSVQGGPTRVMRPRDKTAEGPVDPGGELRGRVAAGDPFGAASVTVTRERPARAILSGAPGATPHVDLVCIARNPAVAANARAHCPLQITVGDAPMRITEGGDGIGHAQLPPLPARGNGAKLAITLREAPGDWFALARIVFDREVPGSANVAGVGWVLGPPSGTRRFLLKGNESATVPLDGAGLVRIDAQGEPDGASRVVAVADGREEVVPLDGTPITLAVTRGSVAVRAEGGAATVAIAQRVPKGAAVAEGESEENDAVAEAAPDAEEETHARASSVLLDPSAGAAGESWRTLVDRSPHPLTSFQDDLGVFIAGTTASYGSVRADDPTDKSVDKSIEEYVGYRRRIESLSLWTISQVNIAERPAGAPTYGGSLTLYEDYDPAHVRLTGTLDYGSQQIEGSQVHTINPRGFLEYSWRATRAFFILPRLGFDGWYTTLHQVPKSTTNIDDSVFNAFRTQRQTFVFLQSLFWLTPFFNDIYYIRARATYDVGNGQLSHVALRPGLLLAFGQLDINGYWETAWYQATPFVRADAGITNSAGLTVEYNFWSGAGSLDIQPGVAGLWNDGGAYTVEAVLNFMIGYRRGLRDYSSLELDFPEQLSDGVPWRGAPMGIAK